jgi:hypothetical protein
MATVRKGGEYEARILASTAGKNASFANPTVFVGLVQWADKVLTE